jgi:8-oxo-dGTP pyrophosphatase MutT (NUDIX family)
MYKVFVENLPVIFTQNSENYPHSVKVEVSKFHDINAIVRMNSSMITDLDPLLVHCEELESDFNHLFQDYQRVVAAGGVVSQFGEVLMIRKNGFWDLPKGIVDFDEATTQTAYREISEECGITGHTLEWKLHDTWHTYFYLDRPVLKQTHWFVFNYSGTKFTKPQREEGITDAVWMSKNQLKNVLNECYGSVRDVLEKFWDNT